MKKQLMTLVLSLLTVLGLSAKCDWSKVSLAYGNTCNVYKFEIAGTVDTCFKTTTIVTNKKTLKKDTFYTRAFGITFADTGKYNVFVKVYNKCLGCDTGFEKLVYVTCKPTTKKCNWSTVKPSYTGAYKSYKFEIGSADTCLSYVNLSYHNGVLDTIGKDRVFGVAFKDTGIYYVISRVHNKCTGCDTSYYQKIHTTNPPTTKKCDWSKVKPGYTGAYKSYKFEISSYDTCLSYVNLLYHVGKADTIGKDRVFGVTFKDTGIYYVISRVHNKCTGCDTSYYIKLNSTNPPTTSKGCDWSKIGLYASNKCRTVVFELGSKDTCITGYSLWAYNSATHKFDTLAHDRVFTRTLDTGWYTFKASFHNKCCNKDTFIYKEIHIGCDSNLMSLSVISRDNIRVFPIPADNKLDICLITSTKQPLVPYLIYDGNGRILYSGLISTYVQLNTTDWKDGVYTIKIGKLNQRIIINH